MLGLELSSMRINVESFITLLILSTSTKFRVITKKTNIS